MSRVSSGSDSKQDYATPVELMDAVERLFGQIVFDLAVEPHNKKHDRYYGPQEIVVGYEEVIEGTDKKKKAVMAPNPDKGMVATDSLAQDWAQITMQYGGKLWLNPPFSHIEPWAKKYKDEAVRGADGLFLVPAGVGSNWYRDHVFRACANTYLLNGRLAFMGNGQPLYNKDCMVIHYHQHSNGDVFVWDWKRNLLYRSGMRVRA